MKSLENEKTSQITIKQLEKLGPPIKQFYKKNYHHLKLKK